MPSDRALHTQLFLVIINHSETWISQSSRNKIKLEKENIEIYIYISIFFMYILRYILYICSILLWIARHYLIVRLIKSYICRYRYRYFLLTEFIIYNLHVYTHYRIQTHVVHVQNNTSIIKQTHNVATPFFPSRPGMKLPIS